MGGPLSLTRGRRCCRKQAYVRLVTCYYGLLKAARRQWNEVLPRCKPPSPSAAVLLGWHDSWSHLPTAPDGPLYR